MEPIDLAEWIRAALKDANISQAEVARRLTESLSRSIDRAAVNKMAKGTRDIAVDEMREIARITGVPIPINASEDNYRPPLEVLGERDLKVFAAVEGGPGEMVVSTEYPIDIVPRPWYMREVRDGYAVLVVGESMTPVFEPNDIAVVNPRLPPVRGKEVILIGDETHGEFRASIKRFEGADAKSWRLRQFNPPKGQKAELIWPKKDWPKALRVVGKYYGG